MAAPQTEQISFTAFGVPIDVSVPARLRQAARAVLPPDAVPARRTGANTTVALHEQDGQLLVTVQGERIGASEDDELALGLLDAQIRAQIALLAPDHVFVHAGVVACGDRAVLLPGFTYSGKTTLTRALVKEGATYYSDELAAIDGRGLVHPYPKPLSIRRPDGSGRPTETPAEALGGKTGAKPVPVALIAVTAYRPGASFAPEPLSPGAALLALLEHTIPARTRPRQALATLKAAVEKAIAWKSERGEAEQAARAMLAQIA